MKKVTQNLLLLVTLVTAGWHAAMAQGYGGRTGTKYDTYVINNDNTNLISAIRMQGLLGKDTRGNWVQGAGLIEYNNGSFYFKTNSGGNHADYDAYGPSITGGHQKDPSAKIILFPGTGLIRLKQVEAYDAFIGGWHHDKRYAAFSHKAQKEKSNAYALLQSSDGNTFVNAANGKRLFFRQNNQDRMRIESNGNVTIIRDLSMVISSSQS